MSNDASMYISNQELSRYVREICMEEAKCEYDIIQTVNTFPQDPSNPLYIEIVPRKENKTLVENLTQKANETHKEYMEKLKEFEKLKINKAVLEDKNRVAIEEKKSTDSLTTQINLINQNLDSCSIKLSELETKQRNITRELERPLEVIIRGIDIVLDTNEKNGLWEYLNCDKCALHSKHEWGTIFSQVTIECHKLIIRSALRICTKKLIVKTKHVQWENQGCLDITPPDYSDRAMDAILIPDDENIMPYVVGINGKDGKTGRDGGTIIFFTEDWTEDLIDKESKVTRLIANGGKGQAPGKGMNGVTREFKDTTGKNIEPQMSYVETLDNSNYTISFDQPAIYYRVTKKKYGTLWEDHNTYYGVEGAKVPSGTDALSSGIPGSGGMNGMIITNHPEAVKSAVTNAGEPGPDGEAYTGGDIWTNIRGSQINDDRGRIGFNYEEYHITVWFKALVGGVEGYSIELLNRHDVYRGKDAPATHAVPVKTSPDSGVILFKYDDNFSSQGDKKLDLSVVEKDLMNKPFELEGVFWYSSNVLGKVLDFAGTCMLSGNYSQAESLVQEYYQVFQENARRDLGSSQKEMNEHSSFMLQRLISMIVKINLGLDYYGNSAGYAPILSLRGNLERYKSEVERAMKTLFFTQSIKLYKEESLEKEITLESMQKLLQTEIEETDHRMLTAREELSEYVGMWQDISDNFKLIQKVKDNMEDQFKKQAEFNIHITGSLRVIFHAVAIVCQFIPKGQPALGSASSGIANMFDVALNPAYWDTHNYDNATKEAAKAVNEMAQNYFKKRDNLTKREEEVKEKLKAKEKELNLTSSSVYTEDMNPKKIESEAEYEKYKSQENMKTYLKNLPDAIQTATNEIVSLVHALPIKEDQIENEYLRLSESNEQFKTYKLQLETLKEYKKDTMQKIIHKKNAIDSSYKKLEEYNNAKQLLRKEASFEKLRVHPAFITVANDLERNALETLRWSQYLLVRAYEASTLQPLNINLDWDMGILLEELTKFILNEKKEDKPIKESLSAIYNSNLDKIREEIYNKISSIIYNETIWRFYFNREDYPELFAQFDEGNATFNVQDVTGMLFMDNAENWVSKIQLTKIEFERKDADKDLNLEINLSVDREGVAQNEIGRYKIHGDEDYTWKWMISGTSSEPYVAGCEMSGFSEDILTFLAPKHKEKLRRFPLFSKFTVKANGESFPKIKSLKFEVTINYKVFSTDNSGKLLMLKSRLIDEEGGTELKSILLDCTKDSRNRSYGFSGAVRYYKHTSKEIELNAALEPQDDFIFDHWQITHTNRPEGEREEILSDICVKVKWHGECMEAVCYWKRGKRNECEIEDSMCMLKAALDTEGFKWNLDKQ